MPLTRISSLTWSGSKDLQENTTDTAPPLSPKTAMGNRIWLLPRRGVIFHCFSPELLSHCLTIVQLEALNLVRAVVNLLPHNPHNYNIQVNTDSIASQQVLESGRGKNINLCTCARQLWLIAANKNFDLTISHKPGSQLVLADTLSTSCSSDISAPKAQGICSSLEDSFVFDSIFQATYWITTTDS